MQDQPSRIDRIESTLESFQQRMDEHFEQQMQLNATLRTELEVLKNAAEALLRTAELHQQNIEILAEAMRHRSDGHGA